MDISEIANLLEVDENVLNSLVRSFPDEMPHPEDLESWNEFVYLHKGQQRRSP
jgi:hypothetical protein